MIVATGILIAGLLAAPAAQIDTRTRDRAPLEVHATGDLLIRWSPALDREALWRSWSAQWPALTTIERNSMVGAPLTRWERLTTTMDGPSSSAVEKFLNLQSGSIERIERNRTATLAALPRDSYIDADGDNRWDEGAWGQRYANLWGLQQIRAEEVWQQASDASGVVVAVIDSGIDLLHEDLQGNIWDNPDEIANNGIDDDKNGFVDDIHGWDFAYGTADPQDRYVHGTHIAGVIGARGDNGMGIAGVVWRVSLMPVKTFNDQGSGSLESIAEGIVYAVDEGADIINLSFSLHGEPSELVRDAIRYAADREVLVVAAAGNSGLDVGDCSTGFEVDDFGAFPACLDEVIAVGATTHFDERAAYSNHGAGLDLLAPGGDEQTGDAKQTHRNILSLRPEPHSGARLLEVGKAYYRERGTSLAAAYVSGALAMARARFPDRPPRLLRAALQKSAWDLGQQGADASPDKGRLDLSTLLTSLESAAATEPEYLIENFHMSPRTIAPGAPARASAIIRNVGVRDGYDIEIVWSATEHGELYRWQLDLLPAGTSRTIEAILPLEHRALRRFSLEIDPDARSVEYYKGNNRRERIIEGVFESHFVIETLTDAPGAQSLPDITKSNAVWQDHRWGNPEIVTYDFQSRLSTRRTTGGGQHVAPAIAGGQIAWQDLRPDPETGVGTWDIRSYSLADGGEVDITSYPGAEIAADAHLKWLVWTDSRNGLGNADIYAYRWRDGVIEQVTDNRSQQEAAAVWGDTVVYKDFRSGVAELRMKNLKRGDDRALTADGWSHGFPRIWRSKIVYEDKRDGNWDIVVQDLRTGQRNRITSNRFDQFRPDICGSKIVWQDAREANWNIWLYDLHSGDKRKVTTNRRDQRRPRIYGNRIVFGDFRQSEQTAEDISLATVLPFLRAPVDPNRSETGADVNLSWSQPPGRSPSAYRVYRSVDGERSWTLLGETASRRWTDRAVPRGEDYRWRITSIDANGGESALSPDAAPISR
jgi:beta propeller repeat protein